LEFPVIVKPVHEDASIGIDANSIVHTEDALLKRVHFILNEFEQPALAEEFISGRELTLCDRYVDGVLATLPISEITFERTKGQPHIVSYEAKWVEESPLYKTTVPECPRACQSRSKSMRDVSRSMRRTPSDSGITPRRMRWMMTQPLRARGESEPDISEDAGFRELLTRVDRLRWHDK